MKNIIKPNDLVKVKVVRNQISIKNVNTCNKKPTIKRLAGNKHLVLSTGEIAENNKCLTRGESYRSLLESNIRLQDLIKENTVDCSKILLLTLTYTEKILDTKKLSEDFKQFIKYIRKTITQFGKIEYINTFEKDSKNLGFHIHAILFFNNSTKSVFLPIETVNEAWRKGFASVGKPRQNKEVYFYLTPHLAKEVTERNSHMHNKALMQMTLPAGLNLYHYSKGIKKPTIYTDTYESVQNYLKQNQYFFKNEQVYKNPMQTYNGNNLYYVKQNYIKVDNAMQSKRKPI